jgi:hypothetical protein
MGEAVRVDRLDEVSEHLFGHLEVGDHPVLQRPDRGDVAGRAADHPLRLDPDRVDLAGFGVDRDHRGLGEDDAAPTHVDERVRGAEVDRHVAPAEAEDAAQPTHMSVRMKARTVHDCKRAKPKRA